MTTALGLNRGLAAALVVAAVAWTPAPARAEVLSLRVGVTPSCPYGLTA